MRPVKIATISPEMLHRIAQRALALQAIGEWQTGLITQDQWRMFERGAYNVIAALEALGFTLVAPDHLDRVWEPDVSAYEQEVLDQQRRKNGT